MPRCRVTAVHVNTCTANLLQYEYYTIRARGVRVRDIHVHRYVNSIINPVTSVRLSAGFDPPYYVGIIINDHAELRVLCGVDR